MPNQHAELAVLADAPLVQSMAIGLMIAGAVILVWSLRTSLAEVARRLLGPRSLTPPTANTRESSRTVLRLEQERAYEPERPESLSSVMSDAEELAQILAERLDRQAARLEQLLAAADERLARLEKAMAEPKPMAHPAPRLNAPDPLSRQIYELSDSGVPVIEIARQLNQQTGKVELILALRQHT